MPFRLYLKLVTVKTLMLIIQFFSLFLSLSEYYMTFDLCFQLIIRATVGSGQKGDIAVDEVTMTPGQC